MDKKEFNKKLKSFEKIWFFAYLLASISMLFKSEFNYNQNILGSDIRIVTPDSEPILYYFTLIFTILNCILGLYFGFIKNHNED